ncbi:MAG: TrmH family RNA methyltransferase [Candidatus Sumerlaeia bacterium]|nr:TrmH family RNA methyltransferase [Candidatus Sumerlaeia bacterium]
MPTPERTAKIAAYRQNLLPFAVAVVNMSKEMNIGSLLRTAHAAAVRELILVGETSYNTYAAATAEKWTPVRCVPAPAEFVAEAQAAGHSLVAVERDPRAISLFEAAYPPRPVFVLGAEKYGVPPEILDASTLIVEIPQWGLVPSLNVAAAGSLVIYDHLAKLCGARAAVKAPASLADLRRLAESIP